MAVTFHKMHGLGNDFILLDLRHQEFQVDPDIVTSLANRHTGIGCDQLLVLNAPVNEAQLASFEVWNADGSRAEQCGNGVRCMALYLKMYSQVPPGKFSLGGPAGDVHIECLDDDMVRVEMGEPDFVPAHIPVQMEPVAGWYTLDIDGQSRRLGAVSMGNPHALMVVEDITRISLASLDKAISGHVVFPSGCNAGFVQIVDRENIRLRVFERGAGETLACGSGACAAVSILRKAGLVEETVNVTQTGGDLIITWTGGGKPIMMQGSAAHVFKGKLT